MAGTPPSVEYARQHGPLARTRGFLLSGRSTGHGALRTRNTNKEVSNVPGIEPSIFNLQRLDVPRSNALLQAGLNPLANIINYSPKIDTSTIRRARERQHRTAVTRPATHELPGEIYAIHLGIPNSATPADLRRERRERQLARPRAPPEENYKVKDQHELSIRFHVGHRFDAADHTGDQRIVYEP